MAYNDTIKLRAYTMYLQGASYEEIARDLRKSFGEKKLKGTTVRSWAEKPDDRGETWEDHRNRVKAVMRRNAEDAAATKLADIRAKSETILEKLYKQLTERSPKVKSFEGAVYAFKTISEFSLALDDKNREQLHPLLVVQAMLEVFQEIPEVRRVIKTNWERIYIEIQERLKIEKKPVNQAVIVYEPDK
ncbi:MAG: hypothetical protein JW807_00845 [Spirochaetes bacterium]|nr:hypothetical protein [Spirochaetota bacterium]